MSTQHSLIWFRKDLRVNDNPALTYGYKAHNHESSTPCRAIFITTNKQWQDHDMSNIQHSLIERHVTQLSKQLAELGIILDVINVDDYDEQIITLTSYCTEHNISHIYANSEVELNESSRDKQAVNAGLPLTLYEADVIVQKGSVLTDQQQMYKVFTPFRNAWLKQLQQQMVFPLPVPENLSSIRIVVTKQSIAPFIAHKFPSTFSSQDLDSKKWPLASDIIERVLSSFLDDKHDSYKLHRDFPAIKGTSGLSPYLAIGAISPKYIVNQVLQKWPNILDNPKADIFCWLNELAWRDFYKHLLFHFPRLCRYENYQQKYDDLRWSNNPDLFLAWCNGETGYPLVDAAMKQLVTTGWMHNRLRMVVASFLTKHLLIDWRLGERFFMKHLIDGDLSANNGGWQWAASTGCDAQPYFRIFNPIRQSERFDKDGNFIKKFIPKLVDVPAKHIHFPHKYLSENNQQAIYCQPVVEHKVARENALALFKQ